MIQKIRKSMLTKGVALLLVMNLLAEVIQPTAALALTGGPSQPEVQGFTPISTSENVDLSTGAFNYNIPLLDVGGYPINISYSSGVTMDQEASWVGLGWSLNPGVMNRSMRGIPDEFKGETIEKEFNMRPNVTAGVQGAIGAELFGIDSENFSGSLSFGMGINWNNYNGYGFSFTISPSFDFAVANSTGETTELGLGVGITASDDGLNINPDISFGAKETSAKHADMDFSSGVGVGLPFNSRGGFSTMTVSLYASETYKNGVKGVIKKMLGTSEAASGGVGSTISFAGSTYVPMVEFPKINTGISFSAKAGLTFFGLDGSGNIGGYYSRQDLLTKQEEIPAYGYLYSQDGQHLDQVIHDFNREKDASYTKGTPNLPVTNYTYDIYTAVGQGVGGMFRPFRNDIGHVYDSKVVSGGVDGSLGIELGTGNLAKGGIDIDVNISTQISQKWEGPSNDALSDFKFTHATRGDVYEPVYFKQVGEMAVDEDPLFSNMKAYHPVAIRLAYPLVGINVQTEHELFSNSHYSIPINFPTHRTTGRSKRNTLFSYLTNDESDYALNTANPDQPLTGMGHHLGELTVTRNDGVRYIYGIPAYNTLQREATFSVGEAVNDGSGIVEYAPGDNSVNNTKGVDHYFERTTTPSYAHAYLLTAVISPDYVDRSSDGLTRDDFGTYTKFTYDRAYSDYKWRVPFGENSANFSEGLLTMDNDNKGSYVYGEKEIWYLDQIETKTHIAVFHTSPRHDAFEVIGENGGLGSRSMKQLDSISLYTKPDFDANGNNAYVVKRVHFVYDYYLCPGVDNNDLGGGKLTLREIYFTYGNSHKGKLSSYKFKYGDLNGDGIEDVDGNAPYNLKNYNMWGSYKPNNTGGVTNAEYPYVEQNKIVEDEQVAQWHLTNIIMPSGGEMLVSYESNDYKYVQNRKAMEFYNVVGALQDIADFTSVSAPNINYLWDPADNTAGADDHLVTIVELPEEGQTWNSQNFRDFMIKPLGSTSMRFNYFMNLSEFGLNSSLSEYVSGYAQVDQTDDNTSAGVVVDNVSGIKYGYFTMVPVHEENDDDHPNLDAHPVSRTTWQWVRLYNPHLAYDQNAGYFDENTDVTGLIEAMASAASSFAEVFAGPNGFIRTKGIGKRFDVTKSWVRLPSCGHGKLGGGARVKQISLSDQWDIMTANTSIGDSYGQAYNYVCEDGTSSGVATFEPLLSKENPLIVPLSWDEKRFGVPDEKYMLEKPYGLSFFPSPRVTYSRVEVRSLDKIYDRDNTITDHYSVNRTGKTVTEFFTTKDFPTIVRQTIIDKKPHTPDLVFQLLKLDVKEHATVSQGYVIELNDMDGKLKSQMIFPENSNEPISGIEYRYGTAVDMIDYSGMSPSTTDPFEGVEVGESKLDNKVVTIAPDGTVEENLIGVEFDIITDFRECKSDNISAGVDGNLAGFLAAILPMAVPTILPTFSKQQTRFRSAVTTKVINRYGILRETVAFDNGAKVSTENLAWDAQTGAILLTRTKNEFGDYYYSLNYPAHWTYDRMGQAYQNVLLATGNISEVGSTDYYTGAGVANLVKGDEVILNQIDGTGIIVSSQKAWVLEKNSSNQVFFIDEDGNPSNITGTTYAKVIRSGRRNQHDVPVGSVVMKSNPIANAGVLNNLSDASFAGDIINASAVEFSEEWGLQCGGIIGVPGDCECTLNQAGIDFIELINTLIGTSGSLPGIISPSVVNLGIPIDLTDPSIPFIGTSLYNAIGSPNNAGLLWIYTEVNSSNEGIVTFSFGVDNNHDGVPDSSCDITLVGPNEFANFPVFVNDTKSNIRLGNFTLPVSDDCDESKFIIQWYPTPEGELSANTYPISGSSPCFNFFNCTGTPPTTELCGINPGDIINPFVQNVQGVWRAAKSWTRLGGRTYQGLDAGAVNTRTQGEYTQFAYFWKYNTIPGFDETFWKKEEAQWTWVSQITPFRGYDQDGMERENMDALFRFSAAINGYANTLPIAVAANATYRQIAYDGFEDYSYYTPEECRKRHFAFEGVTLSSLESHTGRYSLEILPMESAQIERGLLSAGYAETNITAPYTVRACECQGTFGPETFNVATFAKGGGSVAQDKKYVISFWMKKANQGPLVNYYDNLSLSVGTTTSGILPLGTPRVSNIIDGWQKVEFTFTIPGGDTGTIQVSFDNDAAFNVYVDDIRIQPFNSAMKTYVYDPLNLRLMAELDDNNFATFYEYDEEGKLIRIKKETERGIVTIQESRSGIIKQDLNP